MTAARGPWVRGDGMRHSVVETWTKTGDVVDAQPIKRLYNSAKFYPDRISVEYKSTNYGPWTIEELALSGPRSTKSGRSKTSVHREVFHSWNWCSAPIWAREWAEANLPIREVTP